MSPWAAVLELPETASAVRAGRRAARAAARGTPVTVSPVVLHGPPGTGKTAVATAAVDEVSSAAGGRTARAFAANDFDFADTTPEAVRDLAGVDLLVVEDLQHLPPRAAETLNRVLDARAARRRGTLLTANAGPGELALPARLASRLAAGLVVRLPPLSAESRAKAVEVLADRRRVHLTADAVQWLADRPTGGGLRPVLGALETLKVRAAGRGEPLTAAEIADILSPDAADNPTSPDRVIGKVAAAFGVRPADVRGKSRLPKFVRPRMATIFLLNRAGGLSLVRAGKAVGGRDHTTAGHAVRTVESLMATDPDFAARVNRLWAELT